MLHFLPLPVMLPPPHHQLLAQLLLACVLCWCATAAEEAVGPAPIPSLGCGTRLVLPAGALSQITLPMPGDPLLFNRYREYFIYVPTGYDNTQAIPVIYSFHGFYSSAETKSSDDKLMLKSEELVQAGGKGYVLVYGQGMADCGKDNCYEDGYPERTWNTWGQSESPGPMGHTCDQHRSRFGRYGCYTSCRLRANDSELSACFKYGRNSTVPEYDHCHASTCANDTLYMETLMEAVESSVCADKRRQYVTGFSVGGMMAYWVAVKFAERFAAAIPVAGSALMGFWKHPSAPIPLMDIHGTEDKTIPANYSNGFVGHGAGHSPLPLRVPGCDDCSFSDDGFYYTSNYNVTRGVALSNNCSCTGWHEQCLVRPWRTSQDSSPLAKEANWTCFESFGNCAAHPVVRCTWSGNHDQPMLGEGLCYTGSEAGAVAGCRKARQRFFSEIAWDFFANLWIAEGSEKERRLLEQQ